MYKLQHAQQLLPE